MRHSRARFFIEATRWRTGAFPLFHRRHVQHVAPLAPCPQGAQALEAQPYRQQPGVMGGGLFRVSRVLLRPDRKGPVSRLEIADSLGTETMTSVGTSPLELNLFEDPTGGLATGPAEELTTTEIEAQVRLMVSGYNVSVFYLLYTPFIDIVRLISEKGLLPQSTELRGAPRQSPQERETPPSADPGESLDRAAHGPRRAEEVMSTWFCSGLAVLKDPTGTTAGAMGARRWELLGAALVDFYQPIEQVMPLTRVVRKHGLPEQLFVPFLRQLAMSLVPQESRRRTITTLPGLVLGLANGRAPGTLRLPEPHSERVLLVAELLLGVAQETGNTDLAYLGLQLLRANEQATPFIIQKQLTNVFSTAARLQTDWLMRATGQLADVYPRWVDYDRKVKHDNAVRLCQLQEAKQGHEDLHEDLSKKREGGLTSARPDIDDEGSRTDQAHEQHEYFTSRRLEDVERVAALERNVEEALLSRTADLSAEVKAVEQRRLRLRPPRHDAAPPPTEQPTRDVSSASSARVGATEKQQGKKTATTHAAAAVRRRGKRSVGTAQPKRTPKAKAVPAAAKPGGSAEEDDTFVVFDL